MIHAVRGFLPTSSEASFFVFVLLRHLPEVVKIEIVGFAHPFKAFDTLCVFNSVNRPLQSDGKELTGFKRLRKPTLIMPIK